VRPLKGFYDFEAKYTKGMTEYIIPAGISKNVEKRAQNMALAIYKAFELSGCVRIDMIVDEDVPQVIDINTSPGMTETSLVPKAWGYTGRSFDELVGEILKGASLKT
jgi:D-alanine-D-alanine ligase